MLRLPLRASNGTARGKSLNVRVVFAAATLIATSLLVPSLAASARASIAAGVLFAAIALHVVHHVRTRRPVGYVTLDAGGVARTDAAGTVRLADADAPFGLTVLADHARTRALMAFTTPTHTRYVHVVSDEPASCASDAFFASASSIADHDVVVGANANAASLDVRDAARLLEAVRAKWPAATERVFLSASDGSPIVLDRNRLTIGEHVLDLRAPLEWRGFTFHESVGQVATIYQATWVRQGDAELVLVAPMPAELTSWGAEPRRIWKRNARDERLMQALPDAPPPRELRTAIDRLFMLPLRQALDRASLARHLGGPPSRRRPEGRAH
jgi:hypothetical protein